MTTELEEIKRQIKSGDLETARRLLASLTKSDPLNTNAWALLASITDDPNECAECYRRILQIDPGNRPIAAKLLEISSQIQEISPQKISTEGYDPILYCRQCGGPAEVHFVGDLQGKRAICSYCGSEVDLPDSYHRIQNLREHRHAPGGDGRTPEETILPNRYNDLPEPGDSVSYPPELQEIIRTLTGKGAGTINEDLINNLSDRGINRPVFSEKPGPEILQEVQDQGYELPYDPPELEIKNSTSTTLSENSGSFFKRPVFRWRKPKRKTNPRSLEKRILLLSEPLPPDERQNCPNPKCGAVIPKSTNECPWCGQSL